MIDKQQQSYAIPLAFIGMMFFSIGFALGINSFLIPVLKGTLSISSVQSYLLLAATFLPFLIFGYPASLMIRFIGYKRTMAFAFFLFAVAFGIFILSAYYRSLSLFLSASAVSGTANAFLQASVNPYTTILGPIESAARRISVMGICNKLAWPVAPLFLTFVIGKDIRLVQMEDLYLPFGIIISVFVLLSFVSLVAPLPEVKAQGEEACSDDKGGAVHKDSAWNYPHLLLGAIALFLYVGVETISLATMVDYAQTIRIDESSLLFSLIPFVPSLGMVVGYVCGAVFIPHYISQSTALKICSFIALFGSLAVVLTPTSISIYFIVFMALGCSLMWPAIWPLAMDGLGSFTKTGSSILTMAIAGGALLPLLFGYLKDCFGMQNAYWLCFPCFLFILYYAFLGHQVGRK